MEGENPLGLLCAAAEWGLGSPTTTPDGPDPAMLVGALRRVGGLIVDPTAQATLCDAVAARGLAGHLSPDRTSLPVTLPSPASAAHGAQARDGGWSARRGDQSFFHVMSTLGRWVAHSDVTVAAAALQAVSDAVTHLKWGGASAVVRLGAPSARDSDEESKSAGHDRVPEAVAIARLLPAVSDCLECEALRRACRLLYSAVIAKLGPRLALDSLVSSAQRADSVRGKGSQPTMLHPASPPRSMHTHSTQALWGCMCCTTEVTRVGALRSLEKHCCMGKQATSLAV